MAEKQQQLLYNKGITNVPSDALCSDNALAECMGMTYENGEIKPIQNPKECFTAVSGRELTFVHQLPGGGKNYILFDGDTSSLSYKHGYGGGETFIKQIDSRSLNGIEGIGNTLVVSTDKGLEYFLWKGTAYKSLGGKIPEPDVRFGLVNQTSPDQGVTEYSVYKSKGDIPEGTIDMPTRTVKKQQAFNNLVWGLYAENEQKARKNGVFTRPFFIRYALRLYDDEYIYQSQPILVLPSINANADFAFHNGVLQCKTHVGSLFYTTDNDYSEWTDIVSGVDVFATEQATLYDTSQDATLTDPSRPVMTWNGIGSLYESGHFDGRHTYNSENGEQLIKVVTPYDNDYVEKELLDLSRFYKLSNIGILPTDGWETVKINPHVLETLTEQSRLMNDDYYSHCPVAADFMKTYNQRLHLSGVRRGFFGGFTHFILYDYSGSSRMTYVVHIQTSEGEKLVEITPYDTSEHMLHYFYYPDPRATEVDIYNLSQGNKYKTIKLKEHPGLNGAYFLSLPPTEIVTEYEQAYDPQYGEPSAEHLGNIVMVSEAGNPFVFKAGGDVTVGNGDVVGMASQTMALGQEEHGTHPLTVFTTMGIYALRLNSEGVYVSADIFSREVCLHKESITETDGAVYFVSKKGLMVVVGSQVKCVSEQMDGRVDDISDFPGYGSITRKELLDFKGFLNGCRIAYDYRDSQLLIINPNRFWVWVYNMKSDTFSMATFGDKTYKHVVNDYPDTKIQDSNYVVYSLLDKPEQNADNDRYNGWLMTRSMKLEDGLSLKTIMQMRHVSRMEGSMTMAIYASNDLEHWVELNSLTGVPWKYYRFRLTFSNMKATDRFGGTVIVTQTRRTNQLR